MGGSQIQVGALLGDQETDTLRLPRLVQLDDVGVVLQNVWGGKRGLPAASGW